MGAVVPLITSCFKSFLISTDRQVKTGVPVVATGTHLPKQQRPHRLSSFSSPSATVSSQVIQNPSTMTGIKLNSSPIVTDIHLKKKIKKKKSQPGCPEPGDSWNATRRCRPVASTPQDQRCPPEASWTIHH